MRKIFCPSCGNETQINEARAFNFCLHCGYKIMTGDTGGSPSVQPDADNQLTQTVKKEESDVDTVGEKLKEVEFYYQLSKEKREYEKNNEDPVYYLKAQDILVDLSERYPNDYRIWWELCKPVDFDNSLSGLDICDQYRINENYFDKALDKASLPQKRELIRMHDKYIEDKKAVREAAERKRQEEETRRREEETRRQEEEKARRREIERQQEEERAVREREAEERRAAQEREAKERRAAQEREAEERRKQEEANQLEKDRLWQMGIEQSGMLWKALNKKDYSVIDNAAFTLPAENNQTVIGIFKVASNILCLNAYRIDGNRPNTIYRDQTVAVKFDEMGYCKKFDNTAIRIRGFRPPEDELRVVSDGKGGMIASKIPLAVSPEYVASIMRNAKKPLIPSAKKFL